MNKEIVIFIEYRSFNFDRAANCNILETEKISTVIPQEQKIFFVLLCSRQTTLFPQNVSEFFEFLNCLIFSL